RAAGGAPAPATPPPAAAKTAAAGARLARAVPTSVVLQTAANVIRFSHVSRDGVELRRRDVVDELPRRALVVTDIQSAVVADHQMGAVLRINPDGVMIAVRDSLQVDECLAAVGRFGDVQAAGINGLGIARINANLAVIHREVFLVTRVPPGLTLVL